MRIFIDLDDTLAGFRQHAIACGVPAWEGSWYTTPVNKWTNEQKLIQEQTNSLMRLPEFWKTLPVIPRTHELIAAASFRGDVKILTALPSAFANEPAFLDMVRREKVSYCWRKLHVPPEDVIVCMRKSKVQYAFDHFTSTSSILVDDAETTCDEWRASGGIAFHLKRVEDGLGEAIDFVKGL